METTPPLRCRRFPHRAAPLLWALLLAVMVLAATTTWLPALATAGAMSHYALEVAFTPDARRLAGTLDLDWVNATGVAQETLYFRLFPNGPHYGVSETRVSDVRVEGHEETPLLHDDPTVLAVPLGESVAPGDKATVSLGFATTIPDRSGSLGGVLGGDGAGGWWLADWYPIVAGWEDDGWYLDPPTHFGDPTFADAATYDLELTAPAGLTVLGSGILTATTTGPGGEITTSLETGPAQDLTLSVLPSEGDVPVMAEIAGFDVRVTLGAELAVPGLGDAIMEIAGEILPLYEAWLGEYPDRELDITAVSPLAPGNISWSGIIWLDLADLAVDGALAESERDRLRFILAHELAHQWVPGMIGSNNNDHGFMSEGLANTLAVLALREVAGQEAASAWLRDISSGYVSMLVLGRDGVADAPVTNTTDITERTRLVYGKAALGFEAIRQAIGDDAFFAGLTAYAHDFRFATSEPADLLAAFEAASGMDLGDLWRFWFEQADTTVADVDRVLAGFQD